MAARHPRRAACSLFSLCLTCVALGQTTTVADPALRHRAADSSSGSFVLDVIAPPGSGAITLTDNGVPVPSSELTSLPSANAQLVFVIDAVNATLEEVNRTQAAIIDILKARNCALPVPLSILTVTDDPSQKKNGESTTRLNRSAQSLSVHRIPPSQDCAFLLNKLRGFRPGLQQTTAAQGSTADADRFRSALGALGYIAQAEKSQAGAKLVIWCGPGWPYLAGSGGARGSQAVFDSVVYYATLLREARIILYSVDAAGLTAPHLPELPLPPRSNPVNIRAPSTAIPISKDYYRNFLGAVGNVADSDPNDLSLQVLAYNSGGMVLQNNNDLAAELRRCMRDAESISSISYTPTEQKAPNAYHALQATSVTGKPLRVRRGFYSTQH